MLLFLLLTEYSCLVTQMLLVHELLLIWIQSGSRPHTLILFALVLKIQIMRRSLKLFDLSRLVLVTLFFHCFIKFWINCWVLEAYSGTALIRWGAAVFAEIGPMVFVFFFLDVGYGLGFPLPALALELTLAWCFTYTIFLSNISGLSDILSITSFPGFMDFESFLQLFELLRLIHLFCLFKFLLSFWSCLQWFGISWLVQDWVEKFAEVKGL